MTEEAIFEGEIDTATLRDYEMLPQEILGEHTIRITSGAWHIRDMDPSHVILIEQELFESTWDYYSAKGDFLIRTPESFAVFLDKIFMRRARQIPEKLKVRVLAEDEEPVKIELKIGNVTATVPLYKVYEGILEVKEHLREALKKGWKVTVDRDVFTEIIDTATQELYFHYDAETGEKYIYNGARKFEPEDFISEEMVGDIKKAEAFIHSGLLTHLKKLKSPTRFTFHVLSGARALIVVPDTPYLLNYYIATFMVDEEEKKRLMPKEIKKRWKIKIDKQTIKFYASAIRTLNPEYISFLHGKLLFWDGYITDLNKGVIEAYVSIDPSMLPKVPSEAAGATYEAYNLDYLYRAKKDVEIYESEDGTLYANDVEIGSRLDNQPKVEYPTVPDDYYLEEFRIKDIKDIMRKSHDIIFECKKGKNIELTGYIRKEKKDILGKFLGYEYQVVEKTFGIIHKCEKEFVRYAEPLKYALQGISLVVHLYDTPGTPIFFTVLKKVPRLPKTLPTLNIIQRIPKDVELDKLQKITGRVPPEKPKPPKPLEPPRVSEDAIKAFINEAIDKEAIVYGFQVERCLKQNLQAIIEEAIPRVRKRVEEDFREAQKAGVLYDEGDAHRSARHEVSLVVSDFSKRCQAVIKKPEELPYVYESVRPLSLEDMPELKRFLDKLSTTDYSITAFQIGTKEPLPTEVVEKYNLRLIKTPATLNLTELAVYLNTTVPEIAIDIARMPQEELEELITRVIKEQKLFAIFEPKSSAERVKKEALEYVKKKKPPAPKPKPEKPPKPKLTSEEKTRIRILLAQVNSATGVDYETAYEKVLSGEWGLEALISAMERCYELMKEVETVIQEIKDRDGKWLQALEDARKLAETCYRDAQEKFKRFIRNKVAVKIEEFEEEQEISIPFKEKQEIEVQIAEKALRDKPEDMDRFIEAELEKKLEKYRAEVKIDITEIKEMFEKAIAEATKTYELKTIEQLLEIAPLPYRTMESLRKLILEKYEKLAPPPEIPTKPAPTPEEVARIKEQLKEDYAEMIARGKFGMATLLDTIILWLSEPEERREVERDKIIATAKALKEAGYEKADMILELIYSY